LDPDADGKQWIYRGCVIVDQRGYSSDLPAFCLYDAKDAVYPAYSLADAKRIIDEKAAHVNLSDQQIDGLRRLWFDYGNNGSQHSDGNHKFIQRFLDRSQDTRYDYPRACGLTRDCVRDVDEIISAPTA